MFQAEQRGLLGLFALRVFVAEKSFLFRSSDDVSINDQRRRGIVSDRAAQTENDHCVLSLRSNRATRCRRGDRKVH